MAPPTSTTSAPSTLSAIPCLHAFDTRTTTWQSYRDRLSFYFRANRIVVAEDKKALFLWSVGELTYNLLESLVSPNSLTDESTTFDYLVKLLDKHYDAEKNIMTATYDFYSCMQKPGQTFAEWKAELCAKLRHCGFTTSILKEKPQERALRDMYVIGINNPKIRQALLKEQDPDLDKAEKIIQIAERLEQDVRHFGSSNNTSDSMVAKVRPEQNSTHRYRLSNKTSPKPEYTPCQSCGSTKHARSDCKYREFTCNFCHRVGHLERICRSKEEEYKPNMKTSTFQVKHINTQANTTSISLQVNDHAFTFELDTGAGNTIISSHDWAKLGSPMIRQSTLKLQCYSGKSLRVEGECDVHVKYHGKSFRLTLVVVQGVGSPLLGLQWIKIMQLDLNSLIHGSSNVQRQVYKVYSQDALQSLLDRHKTVFDKTLGHCRKIRAHIHLKRNAVPKFFKPRPIAFAYQSGVEEEIQRNVQAGIIERIDTSQWAAPIVPIRKPTGKIRICGDFKVTINSQMLVDQHPIPLIDELLTCLSGGEKFTKLDLSDAYLQIELDDESKKLVVINTPFGLFRYNRMPFGIANAPAIFQRTIEQAIAGIPKCVAYLDDILITGCNEDEHFKTLDRVLSRLDEFGFKCNVDKCSFFQDEVSYLGYIINKSGKQPDPERVAAIVKLPTPKNVKEVEAFIGKVNYYGKFVSNFTDLCEPLNRLRRKDEKWKWTMECQAAFENLKKQIAEETILVHYDANLPIILSTDASNYGLGAVLMHRDLNGIERPIAHASKTLTPAEKNYSQIEKEGLSIIYGIKKFHQYLAGRTFELVTDHQPLLSIFNPGKGIPVATANRLQRWAISLMGYSYKIRYKPTKLHGNADALSRLPIGPDNAFIDEEALQINKIHTEIVDDFPLDISDIRTATSTDIILRQVKQFSLNSWPNTSNKNISQDLLPYYNTRQHISIVKGCLLKDTQVIVPKQLQGRVLQMLHRAHLGIVKMKQLARVHCWWPQIDKDIMELVNSCDACSKTAIMPKEEFKPWPEPKYMWSRVHMDFAGPVWGSKWLIIIDAKSKFPLVVDMGNDTSAKSLCKALEQTFDWLGPPETLVADNGPPFVSYEMKEFYKKYGIEHITTAPYHPASNGIAERFVRSFKEGMIKQYQAGEQNKELALRKLLRTYRWTPHSVTGIPPSDMLLQRPIRTDLVRLTSALLKPSSIQAKFQIGMSVWARNQPLDKRSNWQPAFIKRQLGSMVYEIQLHDGRVWKRHQNQLRLHHHQRRDNQADDLDSLPDDLLPEGHDKDKTKSTPVSPRYPRRNRKPPDRYVPM